MGFFDQGTWRTGRPTKNFVDGRWNRQRSVFRDCFPLDGFEAGNLEADRFVLVISPACPWSHRTIIMRCLRGLEGLIPLVRVKWFLGDDSWELTERARALLGDDGDDESRWLRHLYRQSEAKVGGLVTVPVLWDRRERRIINNESQDLVRMFDAVTNGTRGDEPPMYPIELREEIDAVNARVYAGVNDGVYRCGFARKQEAYDESVTALFEQLDWLETRLSRQRYLVGETRTEADWRLFVTLVRFDRVYHDHFRCNRRRLIEYPNLWAYTRDLYQVPGVKETVDFDDIRNHYYGSHKSLNPTAIVPIGPALDFEAPHGRG